MKVTETVPAKEVEKWVCDYCGKEADGNGYIVAHGSDGSVIYESSIEGDYCAEHFDALLYESLAALPIAERYERPDRESQIEVEKELIRKHLEKEERYW